MSIDRRLALPRPFAHELRNQLSIITGFCELLLEETPLIGQRRNDLMEIQKAAMAALKLLEQLNDA